MHPITRLYPIDTLNAYPEQGGTDNRFELSEGALYVHLDGRRAKLVETQSLDVLIEQLVAISADLKHAPQPAPPSYDVASLPTEEPNYRRLYAEYALAMAYIHESLGITGGDLHMSKGIAPALREIFRLKVAAGLHDSAHH